MKINLWLALGIAFSTSLCAQQIINLPTNAAATNASPTFPPPSPMSQATLDKIRAMTPLFDGKTLNGWKASAKGTNAVDTTKHWTVKDGSTAGLGEGRGVLHTEKSYGN